MSANRGGRPAVLELGEKAASGTPAAFHLGPWGKCSRTNACGSADPLPTLRSAQR